MLKSLVFGSTNEADIVLNGGLIAGAHGRGPMKGFDSSLAGKQISFTAPAVATVTFANSGVSTDNFTFAEIKAALEGAVAGLYVSQLDGAITLSKTGGGVVSVDSTAIAAGTRANGLLGLATVQAGKAYAGVGGVVPRLSAIATNLSGQLVYVVEE